MGKIMMNGVPYASTYDNSTSVKYSNTKSKLNATNVQDAIDEVVVKQEETNNNLAQLSNPNLLINGDFRNPICQRGTEIWASNTNDMYTIDRWKSNGCSVITTNGDYISIVNSYLDSNGSAYLTQPFEKALNGTFTITISVLLVNSGTLKIYLKNNENKCLEVNETGIHTFTFNNVLNASAIVLELVGFYGDLEYIKLEQGSIATPFVPKSYSEEFLACQRYYVRIENSNDDGTHLYGTAMELQTLRVPIRLNTPLRTSPSIMFSGINLNRSSGWVACIHMSQVGRNNNYIFINVTISSQALTAIDQVYALIIYNGYIALDAEIY